MKVLYSDEWVSFTLDEAAALARYERTEVPYRTLEEIERCHDALVKTVGWMPRTVKLLVDVRRAPPRNDGGFEEVIMRYLATLLPRFAASATLVRTAVGKLQTARLAAARGATPHAFDDEGAAIAYLRTAVSAGSAT